MAEDGTVELWHPVGRPVAEVVAWRAWLERHRITQPFKQAHREVYLLTDAERNTGTYSNRFAAHILRQHQFHSLAAVRGWRNVLRLCVDDSAPPATRELPQWGLRAEYWIAGDGDNYGVDTTESDRRSLPFEGDRTLAVILSKAMTLAKDKEINDPTILSQL